MRVVAENRHVKSPKAFVERLTDSGVLRDVMAKVELWATR